MLTIPEELQVKGFDDYQDKVEQFGVYRQKCQTYDMKLAYVTAGLCGEAGEVANKAKKVLRGDTKVMDRQDLIGELGDVLWYVQEMARIHDIKLSEVAQHNFLKLADRAERGVLHGSGDNR